MSATGQNVSYLYDLDPKYIKTFRQTSGALGSNPGGMHVDPYGRQYYLKQYEGRNAVDRTLNEKLVAELYRAANVPHADTYLTEWNGQPALAKPLIDGKELGEYD